MHGSGSRSWRCVLSLLVGFAACTLASAAAGQTPPPAPAPLQATSEADATMRQVLSRWDCTAAELLALEGRWYAACGAAGVLVLERDAQGAPVLRERRLVTGSAQTLFQHDRTIWVEVQHSDAQRLLDLRLDAASAQPAPAAAAWPVPRGDAVPTTSLLAPPRMGGLWSVEGALRPYLPLQSLGVALLASGTLTYRAERAWFLQLQLQPLGGTLTKERDAGLFGAALSFGYDHQYFALGLGAGTLRRGERHDEYDQNFTRTRSWVEHSLGLSVTQHARLGALDGLNFMLTNAFVLDDERWRFGFFDLTVQVPLNRQTWLTAAGGGARQAGFMYGELGLRRLLRGDRGRGSLFLKPSVGVAGIDNRYDGMGPGPMIGCHVEWRR